MGTWEVEAGIAVLLFGLTLPLAIGPMVYLHYRRHGRFSGWSAFLTVVTFLYAWGLVAFTLFPLPTANQGFCSIREEISFWQLRPFASLSDVMHAATGSGFVGVLTSTTFLQVFFNVVLLVPLGMVLAYRYAKSFRFTLLAGLGISLLIETTQGTGIWGIYGCPYRLADVDDLITNTAGAAIGWLVGTALARVLPDPNPPASTDLEAPTVRRRIAAGALDLLFLIVTGLLAQIALNAAALGIEGPEFRDLSWLPAARTFVGTIVVGFALFLAVPMLRRDRATLGQVSTWLAPSPLGRPTSVAPRAVAIRFAVRWLPVLVAAYFQPMLVLGIVVVYESVSVAVRRDRRSLSGVASDTETVTRRQLV